MGVIFIESNLVNILGGSEKLKMEYPIIYNALNNTHFYNDSLNLNTANFLGDDVEDNYMSIEEVCTFDDGIGVLIASNFINPKPILVINILLKNSQTGDIIDSFTTYEENKSFFVERFISNNKKAKEYAYDNLEVDATFAWSDNGNELNEINKVLNTEQYYDGNPIVTDIKVTSPRAKNAKQTIILYDRDPFSGESPDYVYTNVVSPDRKYAILHIPFSGEIKIDEKFNIKGIMKTPEAPELYVNLEGGGTIKYNNNNEIIPQFKIDSSKNTISWDFFDDWNSRLDLTRFNVSTILDFTCKFTLSIVLKGSESPIFHPIIMINSMDDKKISSNVVEIEKISIRWGCIAKSTLIKMLDGSDKLIEDVLIGDKVRTENGYSTVKDIMIGTEKEIIYLSDYNGKSVKITNNHPVKTLRGYIPANKLNAADILVTLDGNFQVKDLFKMDYNNEVYNLELDYSSGIYCNGILTGDFELQNSYKPQIKIEKKESTPLQKEFKKLISNLDL